MHAEPVRHDLGERGLVTLAVPTGPGGHDDLAGRIHPDRGGVVPGGHPHPPLRHGGGAVGGPLGETGVADPGELARGPEPVPFPGPACLGDPLLGQVEGFGVAALVVGDAVAAGVGELAGADHVPAADGQRVQAQLPRGLFHDPLHDQHQLRAGHATVGRGRRLVGGDRAAAGPVGGHLVDAGQLGRGHQRLDRAGERERGVGAHVALDVGGQPEDPAVLAERGADLVALLVAVERGGQVLLPVLHPAHRAAQPQRDPGQRRSPPGPPRTSARTPRPRPGRSPGSAAPRSPNAWATADRTWCGTWVETCMTTCWSRSSHSARQARPSIGSAASRPLRQGGGDDRGCLVEDAASRSSSNMVRSTRQLLARVLVHLRGVRCGGRRPGWPPPAAGTSPRQPARWRPRPGTDRRPAPRPPARRRAGPGRWPAAAAAVGHELRPFQHGQQGRVAQVRGGERGRHAGQRPGRGGVDRSRRGGGERAAHERRVQRPGAVPGRR